MHALIIPLRGEGVEGEGGLILQINCGMRPRTKGADTRLAQDRMTELYSRFSQNKISAHELLVELSFFAPNSQ